jgi:hypothetical protein
MTAIAARRQGAADARSWAVRPAIASIPLAVAIACSLVFLAASLAATFADRTAIRTHVGSALATKAWRHHRNDCLVAYMLLARYNSRLEEALFPKIPQGDNVCGDLRGLLHDPAEQEFWTYQRYLLGVRTIVAPLLSHLQVRDAGRFLLVAGYALVLAAVAALIRRRRQQGSVVRNAPFDVGLFLAASMLMFYVTPRYGTSLAFASSDLAIYALLAAAAFVDPARLSPQRTVAFAALFGAAIAYLELLTGQAPLGLTLLLALVAAGASQADGPTVLARRCLWTGYAFTAGFISCFAIKMATILLIGADTGGFGPSLLHRMGGSIDGERPLLGIDLAQHPMYSPAAILHALVKLGNSAKTLGHGSLALGLAFVLVATAGLARGARARWHRLPDRFERTRTAVLVGAALVTPAWYLVFLNHTIIHATFMIRALVGFIAIGVWFGWSEFVHARSARLPGRASGKPEVRPFAGRRPG